MATDWAEFTPETTDWSEFTPEETTKTPGFLGPSWPAQEGEITPQAAVAAPTIPDWMKGGNTPPISPFGTQIGSIASSPELIDLASGGATAIVQAASKVDPTGFFQNMMARQGIPQSQLVPPEAIRGDIEIASQFAKQALGNVGIDFTIPPSVSEPVKEFAAENIASLPEIAPALALGAAQPRPVARLFQAQMAAALPQSVQALQEAETPSEKLKAGLGVAAGVALPTAIELGLRQPIPEVPPFRGRQIPMPEGARPIPPVPLPKPTVPETAATVYETAAAEARRTGADTINKILALFPSLEGNRTKAREIRDVAFPKTKGAEEYATRIEREPEYIGTPPRPEIPEEPSQIRKGEGEQDRNRGGVQRSTQGEEAPRTAPEQGGVLLTPEERLAEQRALDEALGQTEPTITTREVPKPSLWGGKPGEKLYIAVDESGKDITDGTGRTIIGDTPENAIATAREWGPQKPAPQAGATPTALPPAEPSIPTPELPAAPGAKAMPSQVPISEAKPLEQVAQVSTEPFLGRTKAEWTPEYYKSLSPENRRAARAQVISALKSEGGTTRVTQESKPPVVIKAIHELLDLREKKRTAQLPVDQPVPIEYTEAMQLWREGQGYEGRLFSGAYDAAGLRFMGKGAPMRKAISLARKRYNDIREQLGLPKVSDWSKRPERLIQRESIPPPATAEPPRTLPPEPPVEPLQAGLGIPGIEKLDRKFNQLRQSLSGILQRGGERRQMDQTLDATETMSNVVARQATNQLRLNGTPAELNAIYPFIEAKGDINRLTHFITQATGKNETAVEAARYAQAHWNDPHFQALAARAKAISDAQIAQEQAAGINTEYRDAYLPHVYDQDLLMGFNRPFVIAGKGTGIGTGFKKGRTFETIYDAIEAGYPVKTLNAADALEPRIRSGQKLINRVEWSDSFRHVMDPVDGEPIVTSLVRHARAPGKPGWEAPPAGYVRRTVIPGVDVAVHEGYASLWDALTGTSRISGSVPGKLALETEGALKHGLLLFDTFHVSRILQKELFLVGPKKMGWRKGLTLLEYSDADLAKALHENLITPDMANFARANRGDAELLMRSGLNVGRIQENLYNSVVRQIPVLGKFNKWVFEKMTRGAMLQSALIELERVQRDFGLTRQEAGMKVARDLNAYFGNLGRQGIFKSGTSMDVARLVALAPQWVESMLRTEVGSVAKGVIDPIKYRKLAVSSLPLAVGTGLAAYFVATQILNLVTRRHPTWENPEKGHKFDAWIPDFTGKTKGYFLSPFSVPAEITHDMIRYARTEPDTIAAASRILSNKASPLWRASKTLLTGKDWDQEKLIGSWDRIKAAAINLVPMPIGAAPLVMGEKYPGQAQRQITASLGIKTEQAPTAVQQISEIKRTWSEKNPDPKIRHSFEQALKSEYPLSDYVPLRRALAVGDIDKAAKEYDALITEKGKKQADIREALRPFTGGREVNGVYREAKPKPIGGQIGSDAEAKFKASLTPAERKLYQEAIAERKAIWTKFLKLMERR